MIRLPADKEKYGYLFMKELEGFTYETITGKIRRVLRKKPGDMLHLDKDGHICYREYLIGDLVEYDHDDTVYFVVENEKGTLEEIIGLREIVIKDTVLKEGSGNVEG